MAHRKAMFVQIMAISTRLLDFYDGMIRPGPEDLAAKVYWEGVQRGLVAVQSPEAMEDLLDHAQAEFDLLEEV